MVFLGPLVVSIFSGLSAELLFEAQPGLREKTRPRECLGAALGHDLILLKVIFYFGPY